MEEGWILDSFAKNDLFIDRAFKAYLKYIYEHEIPEQDSRELQLDLYKKTQDKKNFEFRMIVGLADANKKTVRVGDGHVKVSGFNFECLSNEFATYSPIDANETLKQKFGENIEVLKCNFSKPILTNILLVKFGGKTSVGIYHEDKNQYDQFFVYDF